MSPRIIQTLTPVLIFGSIVFGQDSDVERLQRTVMRLERRIAELEKKLADLEPIRLAPGTCDASAKRSPTTRRGARTHSILKCPNN